MIAPEKLAAQAEEAAAFIRGKFDLPLKHAIILGTGAGVLAEQIDIDLTIDYGDIPNFPKSTALGHKGQLVCGRLAEQPVIAMQGRFHLYEGYDVDQATLPIHVMHHLGIDTLFVSNASGGMNSKMKSGAVSYTHLTLPTTPYV